MSYSLTRALSLLAQPGKLILYVGTILPFFFLRYRTLFSIFAILMTKPQSRSRSPPRNQSARDERGYKLESPGGGAALIESWYHSQIGLIITVRYLYFAQDNPHTFIHFILIKNSMALQVVANDKDYHTTALKKKLKAQCVYNNATCM